MMLIFLSVTFKWSINDEVDENVIDNALMKQPVWCRGDFWYKNVNEIGR